jgi:hypothetical protein
LKSKLKSESDVEVERLRSQLSIAAAERQFRFSKLHEKRADAIAEVYALLKPFVSALADYVKILEPAGGPSREDRNRFDARMKIIEHRASFEAKSGDGTIVRQFPFDDNASRSCIGSANKEESASGGANVCRERGRPGAPPQVMAKGWKRRFDDPIPLPDGRQLITLEDAGAYITDLPKAEHEEPEWQAAIEALMLVADLGGPTMFARIGVMRALNRGHVREFNPDRKDKHWGKRKLRRDQ